MMKVFFISPFCLLRPTTNRIFDVRFCDHLAGMGADVTMIHPYYYMKENLDEKDIATAYRIKHPVKFSMLKTSLKDDSQRWWQLTVLMISFFFRSIGIIYSNRKDLKNVYIISRDNKSSLPMMVLKKLLGRFCPVKMLNTVHEVKAGPLHKWMYRNYNGIFVTTEPAKNKLVKDFSVSESSIERLISPVSENNYSISKAEARKKIGYFQTQPLVVYTGKLGKGVKELDYIVDAASSLPHYKFILTGGKQETVDYFSDLCKKRNIQNVMLPGFITDPALICAYQVAADALVSYYSKLDHMVEYNFPQKIVEYMYSRSPIVTPDFPATHDVINSGNAVLVDSDNAVSLAEGITRAIENKESSGKLAEKALHDIKQFSFAERSERIMKFLNEI